MYYTAVCEKFNRWIHVPPNISYIDKEQEWAQYDLLRYPDVTLTSSDNCHPTLILRTAWKEFPYLYDNPQIHSLGHNFHKQPIIQN